MQKNFSRQKNRKIYSLRIKRSTSIEVSMASELTDETSTASDEKRTVPSIEITLTTFSEDENGKISATASGKVKIDGEDDCQKELHSDCSIFKSAIIRNLLVLSFGQFLLFMAFDSLPNLHSYGNGKGGLGAVSLAAYYGLFTLSSFFLPTLIIKSLGCKKTLIFATIGFCPYILGNFYPKRSTFVPTAVICGLVAGPLWSARSTYLNQISYRYARLQRTSVEIMNAWFFSVCTAFQQNTEIWGNLLFYYVLKTTHGSDLNLSRSVLDNCGLDFCEHGAFSSNPDLQLLSEGRRYIFVTIFTALVLTSAFFMTFFLDPLESEEMEEGEEQTFSHSDLLAAFYQFSKLDQILLLSLSLYTGIADGFYKGDYTKAYVTCVWGISYVGPYVSICYGVVSTLVALTGGPCVQILGRAGLFFLAALGHLTMCLALTLWKPDPEHTTGFFLIAGAHGIGNGVWISQLVALYGVLFKENEEAAFSCFYFLKSLGFLLTYSYSSYLCTRVKLFIAMAALAVGLVSYLVLEVRIARQNLVEYELKRQE